MIKYCFVAKPFDPEIFQEYHHCEVSILCHPKRHLSKKIFKNMLLLSIAEIL